MPVVRTITAETKLDPRLENVVVAEYRRRLRDIGLYPASNNDIEDMGVADVPIQPLKTRIGNIIWTIGEMEDGKNYSVPTRVFNRLHLLEEHFSNVRLLWADEKYARPNLTTMQEEKPNTSQVRAAVPQLAASSTSANTHWTLTEWGRAILRRLDPKLIAVLLTTHERGLWVCLGTWLHDNY